VREGWKNAFNPKSHHKRKITTTPAAAEGMAKAANG
jgi:hypothetical protein